MLCSLHHPNIVRFYGMSVDSSRARGASYFLISDLKDCDLRYVRNTLLTADGKRGCPRTAILFCAHLPIVALLTVQTMVG